MILLLIAIGSIAASTNLPRDTEQHFAFKVACDVTAIRQFGSHYRQSEPYGSSVYVFQFSGGVSAGDEMQYFYKLDDGRSWYENATVRNISGNGYPSFSATLDMERVSIKLWSDPKIKGRILFDAIPYLLDHGGGQVKQRGKCRITSEAKGEMAQ